MSQTGTQAQSSNTTTYYTLLGLHPSASVIDIRRAYRELSKQYHPDTTELPDHVATAKFQEINEAYATLSHPERRLSYDLKIGYSRFGVIQIPTDLNHPTHKPHDYSKSMYLDASDRPLSSGEIFVLFVLGLTFVGCLVLAIAIAALRGEPLQTQLTQPTPTTQHLVSMFQNHNPQPAEFF
ncbi:J domain-containing protein [Sphaerospermopsis kisseleviana CS-549]|uniref:Heat shock protein DnaJ domain-containing protein n=2 Tax=Sphaerospermopsis TaxID=752201 RepID=A0A479ZVU2_9CYAN|nr:MULTISPECIES: J domain-containing protein [Sphaerospermopsis]MBD2134545.1 J domain-containing protein [Sphaerospermopsis sp. FACHB-1094]MBD2148006.1 J domain-containing protein [Sphaerospermopsis sp. FACHB-1194]BAZ82211.1 heat shock protein DnaJ domain-containing protein [Sphaerospermopsis kisseleviana NIES-73]MDB9444565.1 J domain-containing protein [Sphaerospermopsis kisseleviana CS-549]GCL36667.1 heat shock protein DnaJ domain-containing protein [Sphaerospermopsis reniformis]